MGNQIPPTPASEYISVSVAASKKYLNLSRQRVAQLCQSGVFKTAFKGGSQTKNSKWQVLRSEIIAHKVNGSPNPYR